MSHLSPFLSYILWLVAKKTEKVRNQHVLRHKFELDDSDTHCQIFAVNNLEQKSNYL